MLHFSTLHSTLLILLILRECALSMSRELERIGQPQSVFIIMSAYTEIIFPCKPHPGRYKKSSTDTTAPPSGSYSPLLSLWTGISDHCSEYSVIGLLAIISIKSYSVKNAVHTCNYILKPLVKMGIHGPDSTPDFTSDRFQIGGWNL
jgi:hypothetical protein